MSLGNTQMGLESARSVFFTHGVLFPALEYLNRSFEGKICREWLKVVFQDWMGSIRRECIVPKKYSTKFSGLYLPQNNLEEAELSGSTFFSVNLEKTSLFSAILTTAEFSKSNLKRVNLLGARLEAAKFIGTDLRSSRLEEAIMVGSSFIDADLRWANLRRADVSQVRILVK